MTAFTLKIIAILSMILDHIKYAIPQTECFVTEYLGRIAFPLFAFFISEGFIHTHSRKKYMLRMLIFAVISQIPFYLFSHNVAHSTVTLNVLFTFEIALVGLCIIDFFKSYDGISKVLNFLITVVLLLFILAITYFIHPDYSWYGVLIIWIFYIFRNSKTLTSIFFTIITILYYLSYGYGKRYDLFIPYIYFNLLSMVFILFYNGKQGKKMKYFFYIFYPAHLLIFYFINLYFVK